MTIPAARCRICNSAITCATSILETKKPEPIAGDASICFNCGAFSIFDSDLTLRAGTDEERAPLPDIALRAIAVIRARGRIRPP